MPLIECLRSYYFSLLLNVYYFSLVSVYVALSIKFFVELYGRYVRTEK